MRLRFSTLVAASAAALLFLAAQALPAHAESILNFGLNNSNSITATANGAGTSTTITTTGSTPTSGYQKVGITLLNGTAESPSVTAYLYLSATSVDPVTSFHGSLYQDYDGTFAITKNADGTGTNYLSGTFTNFSFDSQLSGLNNGTQATLSATDPTANITFTSSVISALNPPSAASFTFSNLDPLHQTGTTIANFIASGSGTFSGTVPEPSTLALAGFGALGLIGYGLRRRKGA